MGCRRLYRYAINVSYEIILCSQVSKPLSWYSYVYGGLISQKCRRIIQGNGWWNQNSYEKGHVGYFSRRSVDDCNVLPGTWSFKFKRKPDWTISKFKARYCLRGGVQKRLSPKPLNSYSSVVHWPTVRLLFILKCILGFHSQIVDFINDFAQADIPSG